MLAILAALAVLSFGAKCDGVTDDRLPVQSAITWARASGATRVEFPPGECVFSRADTAYYDLRVTVSMHGEGTTLRQAPGQAASVSLLYVTGPGIRLDGFVLDGARLEQLVPSEHRHGIFAEDAPGLEVRAVTARNFTGDGFYLYHGVANASFDDVTSSNNARNGITFGATVDVAALRDSRFVGNNKQQVDSETGGSAVISRVLLERCLLDPAGASNDYALTISGTGDVQGRDWMVRSNIIRGPVFMVWVDGVVLVANEIDNPLPRPAVTLQREVANAQLLGNTITQRQTLLPDIPAVWIVGTAGSAPHNVLIAGNPITVMSGLGYAIKADGVTDVDIIGNTTQGGAAALRVRATVPERPVERVALLGNTLSGYTRAGIEVFGNGTAQILSLESKRNTTSGAGAPLVIAPNVVVQSILN